MTSIRRTGWTALALLALMGCETSTPPATPPAGSETKALPVEPKKEADSGKLSEAEIADIKKLPEAEQGVALSQVNCPVSGAHLGKMGMPIKQTIDGQTFYLCCGGCEDEVKENPKGVLAKLKK